MRVTCFSILRLQRTLKRGWTVLCQGSTRSIMMKYKVPSSSRMIPEHIFMPYSTLRCKYLTTMTGAHDEHHLLLFLWSFTVSQNYHVVLGFTLCKKKQNNELIPFHIITDDFWYLCSRQLLNTLWQEEKLFIISKL